MLENLKIEITILINFSLSKVYELLIIGYPEDWEEFCTIELSLWESKCDLV